MEESKESNCGGRVPAGAGILESNKGRKGSCGVVFCNR